MKFGFLGGAMEIGGSAILLKLDGKNLLLDAGIRQSGGKDPLPDYRMVQEWGGIDAVIISHAHMDHIGTLPLISREYPSAPVYMNRMTMDLTGVLLRDSLKIMGRWEEEIPHYAPKDVSGMMDRIVPVAWQMPYEILDGMKLTLYPAGHIAGAACIYLQGKEGSVFYSGDFSSFSQRAIEGIRIPKLRPDAAIVESTYGDRLHSNRQAEERVLVDTAAECIAKKGKMLIPAFALGRAQEVILILKSAMDQGILPRTRVYVDGMVRDINTAFLANPLYLKNSVGKKILRGLNPFADDYVVAVKPTDDRDQLLHTEDPVIVISSSGMLTGGPSAQYAAKIAPMENGYIVITGYQDEEAPGRRILEVMEQPEEERYLTLNGVRVPVRCTIRKAGLSAHGDKDEIRALLERLSSRNIFLVHGDGEVVKGLGRELGNDFWGRIHVPGTGEEYELEIRSKRKQQSSSLPYSMQKAEKYQKEMGRELWDYWKAHYEGRCFTILELFYIWSGKWCRKEEEAEDFKKAVLESIQFELNPRRLYLFQAREEEEIKKDLLPKETTPQELEAAIRELFGGYAFKKISYRFAERRVTLNFDYPDAVPETIEEACRQFEMKTGFSIGINESMNFQEAGLLLRQLFGPRILKISYHAEKRLVHITLSEPQNGDQELCRQFTETTGWRVSSDQWEAGAHDLGKAAGNESAGNGSAGDDTQQGKRQFLPPPSAVQAEQNVAMQCIDLSFSGKPHRPYKKSVKTDGKGRYIELAFVSPAVGERYGALLEEISGQIGWRLNLSESVNQMEVLAVTAMKLKERGLMIVKGPSYKPMTRSAEARVRGDAALASGVCEEIEEETGCSCSLIWEP